MSRTPGEPRERTLGAVPRPRSPRTSAPGRARGRTAGTGRPLLPSLVALAAVAALCLLGLVFLAARFAGTVRAFFGEAALALVLAAATLVLGYWILRRIRPVREPDTAASLTAAAFGLTAAAGAAVVANGALGSLWAAVLGLDLAGVWGPSLTAPLNEELLKLAGIVLVAVAFPYALRVPVDGFVLGALVGLGFEVTENAVSAMNAVVEAGGVDGAAAVVRSAAVRVALTGLASHWTMSAVAGTAVGLLAASAWRPGARRAAGAAGLVLLAMAMHGLLDSPLPGGAAGTAVTIAVNFLIAAAVYLVVRHTHRRRVRASLAAQGEDLGMRRSDAEALATRRGRRSALRRIARPERPAVQERQGAMLATAEDHAAGSAS